MVRARGEQRTRYEGIPQRAWVTARLIGEDGTTVELKLVADTGNPLALVVSDDVLYRMSPRRTSGMPTNFGALYGAWIRVMIPQVGVNELVLAYGSDTVVRATRESSRDFDGLIGLPLLRLTEFGGDADHFWLREAMR